MEKDQRHGAGFRKPYAQRPSERVRHVVHGERFLEQLINAEKHFSQERERLKAEGWVFGEGAMSDSCWKD